MFGWLLKLSRGYEPKCSSASSNVTFFKRIKLILINCKFPGSLLVLVLLFIVLINSKRFFKSTWNRHLKTILINSKRFFKSTWKGRLKTLVIFECAKMHILAFLVSSFRLNRKRHLKKFFHQNRPCEAMHSHDNSWKRLSTCAFGQEWSSLKWTWSHMFENFVWISPIGSDQARWQPEMSLTLIWIVLSKVPADPTSKLIKQSSKLQLGVPYNSLVFAYHRAWTQQQQGYVVCLLPSCMQRREVQIVRWW